MFFNFHTHFEQPQAIVNLYATQQVKVSEGYLYSLGIHPWKVTENYAETIKNIETLLVEKPSIVAIGETGLDRLKGAELSLQMDCFKAHVELSERFQKPLIIHCVRAFSEIAQLHKSLSPTMPWIIHGFRANEKVAQMLSAHGIYMSVGEHSPSQSLRAIPTELLLAETDDTQSITIEEVYQNIATTRSIPLPELQKQIQANVATVLGIK